MSTNINATVRRIYHAVGITDHAKWVKVPRYYSDAKREPVEDILREFRRQVLAEAKGVVHE